MERTVSSDVLTCSIPISHPSSVGAPINQAGKQQAWGHWQGWAGWSAFQTPFPEDCLYRTPLGAHPVYKAFSLRISEKITRGNCLWSQLLEVWRKTGANNRLQGKVEECEIHLGFAKLEISSSAIRYRVIQLPRTDLRRSWVLSSGWPWGSV